MDAIRTRRVRRATVRGDRRGSRPPATSRWQGGSELGHLGARERADRRLRPLEARMGRDEKPTIASASPSSPRSPTQAARATDRSAWRRRRWEPRRSGGQRRGTGSACGPAERTRHADHARSLGPAEQGCFRLGEEAMLARDRPCEQPQTRDAAPGGVLRVDRVGDQAAVRQIDVDAGAVTKAEHDRQQPTLRSIATPRARRPDRVPDAAGVRAPGVPRTPRARPGRPGWRRPPRLRSRRRADQRPGVSLRASRGPQAVDEDAELHAVPPSGRACAPTGVRGTCARMRAAFFSHAAREPEQVAPHVGARQRAQVVREEPHALAARDRARGDRGVERGEVLDDPPAETTPVRAHPFPVEDARDRLVGRGIDDHVVQVEIAVMTTQRVEPGDRGGQGEEDDASRRPGQGALAQQLVERAGRRQVREPAHGPETRGRAREHRLRRRQAPRADPAGEPPLAAPLPRFVRLTKTRRPSTDELQVGAVGQIANARGVVEHRRQRVEALARERVRPARLDVEGARVRIQASRPAENEQPFLGHRRARCTRGPRGPTPESLTPP